MFIYAERETNDACVQKFKTKTNSWSQSAHSFQTKKIRNNFSRETVNNYSGDEFI